MINDFTTTILNSLSVFVIVGLTLFLKKKKILHPETPNVLRPIIFKFVLPFFVFRALYTIDIAQKDLLMVITLVGICILLVSLFYIITKTQSWNKSVIGAVLITMVGFQVGPFAYPFVQLNFDESIFSKVVVLDITLFITIMVFGPIIASILGSEDQKVSILKIIKRIFSDIILLTVIFTFAVNASDIHVSKYIINVVNFVAGTFSFLTLVFLTFSLKVPNLSRMSQVLQTFLFRNIILILISIALLTFVIDDSDLKKAFILTVFTPFSSFALVYTDKYKINSEVIAQISMFSLIMYLVIYPFVVTIAKNI